MRYIQISPTVLPLYCAADFAAQFCTCCNSATCEHTESKFIFSKPSSAVSFKLLFLRHPQTFLKSDNSIIALVLYGTDLRNPVSHLTDESLLTN